MSITINIEDLLQQRIVESSRIEYKKDWNPSTIIHSICAFANDIENDTFPGVAVSNDPSHYVQDEPQSNVP